MNNLFNSIDKRSYYMKLLTIDHYPFKLEDLKSNYRNLVKKYHPDTCTEEVTPDKIKDIIIGYKYLIKYASDIDESIRIKEENEIKDLFEFTKPCLHKDCKNGIRYYESYEYDDACPKCNDTLIIKLKCKYCDKGLFMLRNGNKITCKSCQGTGIFKTRCNCRDNIYFSFFRRGHYITKTAKCTYCNGTGKIKYEPLNPVIRKGAILK
jgi:hypothetical protein